jgi:hypothetical protein
MFCRLSLSCFVSGAVVSLPAPLPVQTSSRITAYILDHPSPSTLASFFYFLFYIFPDFQGILILFLSLSPFYCPLSSRFLLLPRPAPARNRVVQALSELGVVWYRLVGGLGLQAGLRAAKPCQGNARGKGRKKGTRCIQDDRVARKASRASQGQHNPGSSSRQRIRKSAAASSQQMSRCTHVPHPCPFASPPLVRSTTFVLRNKVFLRFVLCLLKVDKKRIREQQSRNEECKIGEVAPGQCEYVYEVRGSTEYVPRIPFLASPMLDWDNTLEQGP